MKHKIIAVICTVALCFLTSACGLHLRGMNESDYKLSGKYTSIYLSGSPTSKLYQLLYAKLKALDIPMVETPKEGTVTIFFSGPSIQKSLAAVDSRSQEVEYALSSKTIYYFSLYGDKNKPTRHVAGYTRGLFNKNDEVLASANEGIILQDELVQQTAEDIFTQFLRQ